MIHRTEEKSGFTGRIKNDMADQVITFPNPQSSNLFISSSEKIDGTYQLARYKNESKLIDHQVTQTGLKYYRFNYSLSNSNPKNNTFFFELEGILMTWTATMPTENFITVASLMDELIMQLNMFIAPDVFAWTFSPPLTNNAIVILSCTKNFKFLDNSSAVNCGFSLYGIQSSNNFTSGLQMSILPELQYTKYIDMLISEIKNDEILNASFSQSQNFDNKNHLYRIYIDDVVTVPRIIEREIINIDYFKLRNRDIFDIEISLFDEYKTPIYSEVFSGQNGDIFEIPYIKYELIINTIA